ncbi:MAG: trypsin-like peptidase domain-containing protein [Clostridia bacterium]|nr:trypsin-like peptidase domain-containing protein [Clostridia bacterium]
MYDNNFGGLNDFAPPPIKKEKKRYGVGVVIVASLLAAVIGAVTSVTVLAPKFFANNSTMTEKGETILNKVNINVDETAENIVEAVAKKVTPSAVGIRTTTSVMSFFGGTQEASGDGSGVIYSSDGYIITNYHVIAGAIDGTNPKIAVYLDSADSEGYSATVVGYNISADLAVIKIDAKNLTAIELANSDNLRVGQYVITIGNPGGLEFMDSVTYGVISGLNRVVSTDSDVKLIQTDAAINPGNSGGALVNAKGELVGINSSKIVSEEFEGMGFAIPSNTVKEICDGIIDRENSPEPYIGISISERYTADVLAYYGYPAGAVVLSVLDDSPAQKSGIAKGDIITEFGGKKISEYPILENEIMNSKPGDKVTIKIYRSGKYYNTEVTVGSNNLVN